MSLWAFYSRIGLLSCCHCLRFRTVFPNLIIRRQPLLVSCQWSHQKSALSLVNMTCTVSKLEKPYFHFHTNLYFLHSCKIASWTPGGENQVQIVWHITKHYWKLWVPSICKAFCKFSDEIKTKSKIGWDDCSHKGGSNLSTVYCYNGLGFLLRLVF